jgi:hypothetical protein
LHVICYAHRNVPAVIGRHGRRPPCLGDVAIPDQQRHAGVSDAQTAHRSMADMAGTADCLINLRTPANGATCILWSRSGASRKTNWRDGVEYIALMLRASGP